MTTKSKKANKAGAERQNTSLAKNDDDADTTITEAWQRGGAAILNADVWRRIQAFTATLTAPVVRTREERQEEARRAVEERTEH